MTQLIIRIKICAAAICVRFFHSAVYWNKKRKEFEILISRNYISRCFTLGPFYFIFCFQGCSNCAAGVGHRTNCSCRKLRLKHLKNKNQLRTDNNISPQKMENEQFPPCVPKWNGFAWKLQVFPKETPITRKNKVCIFDPIFNAMITHHQSKL